MSAGEQVADLTALLRDHLASLADGAPQQLVQALEDGAELVRPGDLFAPAQAAEFLEVNRTTVSRWKREGVMPTPFQDLGTAGSWTLWVRSALARFKAQRTADERQPAGSATDV